MRLPVMEVNEGGTDDLLLQLSCRRGKVIFQPFGIVQFHGVATGIHS